MPLQTAIMLVGNTRKHLWYTSIFGGRRYEPDSQRSIQMGSIFCTGRYEFAIERPSHNNTGRSPNCHVNQGLGGSGCIIKCGYERNMAWNKISQRLKQEFITLHLGGVFSLFWSEFCRSPFWGCFLMANQGNHPSWRVQEKKKTHPNGCDCQNQWDPILVGR